MDCSRSKILKMIEISSHFGFVSLCFVSLTKQSAGEWSAVMFGGWAQTLKQSMKSDITVRSEVQNSQYISIESTDFHIFILFLFYIYPLTHFLLSLHFIPSLQTQSAFYTAVCTLHPVCSLRFTPTVQRMMKRPSTVGKSSGSHVLLPLCVITLEYPSGASSV